MLPKSSVGWGGWVEGGREGGPGAGAAPVGPCREGPWGGGCPQGGRSWFLRPCWALQAALAPAADSDLSFNLFFISIKHP